MASQLDINLEDCDQAIMDNMSFEEKLQFLDMEYKEKCFFIKAKRTEYYLQNDPILLTISNEIAQLKLKMKQLNEPKLKTEQLRMSEEQETFKFKELFN